MQLTGQNLHNEMRNATCVWAQTSKFPTRVAILFIFYSVARIHIHVEISIYFCLSDFSGEYICGMRENGELIKEDFFMRFVLECVFMSLSAILTAQTITVIYLKQIWQRFMARNWQHALDLNQMR